MNLSSHTLSPEQEQVLSRGSNNEKIPVPQIVAAIESALSKVSSPVDKSKARIKVSSLLAKPYFPLHNLTPCQLRALKELRQKEDLAILPSYKGAVTVVMDRASYEVELQAMLDEAQA